MVGTCLQLRNAPMNGEHWIIDCCKLPARYLISLDFCIKVRASGFAFDEVTQQPENSSQTPRL